MATKKEIREVVVVDYLRTPFSRSRPMRPERDWFNKHRMDEFLAMLIEELVRRTGIKPEEVGDCITGCALQMGEQYLMGGRSVSLVAGCLPLEVPAMGVERVCNSSASAVQIGAMEIMCGVSDIVICGGIEHMTHLPMGGPKALEIYKDLPPLPSPKLIEDTRFDAGTAAMMGLTAEKLFSETDDISKEDMDRWSLRSHQRAAGALEDGFFKGEILPVKVTLSDGTEKIVDRDQSIRPDTTYEKIAALPPAFKEGGFITAGNSSPLNAGATAVMVMSKEKAEAYGLKPLATIRGMGMAGCEPDVMGKAPVPASRKALANVGFEVDDIDFWEINEAFAIVTLWDMTRLGIKDQDKKVNIKGGAIAIGHPLGATGARLVGTLARILNLEKARYGLATMCGGGGQATATILEREEY